MLEMPPHINRLSKNQHSAAKVPRMISGELTAGLSIFGIDRPIGLVLIVREDKFPSAVCDGRHNPPVL